MDEVAVGYSAHAQSACAGGRAGNRLPVRRAISRRCYRPSQRDERARAASLAGLLLLWAGASGAGAGGVGGQGGSVGRCAACFRFARAAKWPGSERRVSPGAGGGLGKRARSEGILPSARAGTPSFPGRAGCPLSRGGQDALFPRGAVSFALRGRRSAAAGRPLLSRPVRPARALAIPARRSSSIVPGDRQVARPN